MIRNRSRALGVSLAGVLTAGFVVPLAATSASAATVISDDIVINEVYGGGGNSGAVWTNDFVELYNVGTEPVSVDGWSVQYFSASGGFGALTALSGTIEPGQHYLVQGAAGNGGTQALPTPDAVGTFAAAGANGIFALVDSTSRTTLDQSHPTGGEGIVDLVGYGTASHFSGTAAAPGLSNTTSASRTQNTGENSADFQRGEPTPTNSGNEGADPVDPEPDPTDPVEPVDPIEPGTVVPIAQIQGTGDASPLVGQTVTTEGVVTAVYATGGLNGFVMQTAGTGGALDLAAHTASHGIFVYGQDAASTVQIGESVQVTGSVSEYFGMTQISASARNVAVLSQSLGTVEPVTLDAFPASDAERETLEAMLYLPAAGQFTVTDNYETNKYGEVSLVQGDQPLRQPGDMMAPGPEATELFDRQLEEIILLDDAKTTNFSTTAGQTQPMSWLSQTEPVRVGASVTFDSPVVVYYGFDKWRFQLTSPWESEATDGVTFENTRTDAPREVGGDVSVGSFNVLNYFTTLGVDTAGCTAYRNIYGEGTNVRGGCDPRGAWDQASLERQQVKIVKAINALDSSVLGLLEIENSARLGEAADEATATLVAALNADAGAEKWAYVPTDEVMAALGASPMDQDVIASAIIYQPAEVTLVEAVMLADDPAFTNARDPLGAIFEPVGAEGAAGEPFLFVINHFKSKGSTDQWDAGKPQDPVVGNAETSRINQANGLATFVAQVQEEKGIEDVFLAGDFNAYTYERPLQVFYDLGYTNLAHTFEPDSWSYTYGSRVGSLDHVLASASALERVTDATHWNINSPESVSLEYGRYLNNVRDVYAPNVYRSSDHDPLKVGVTGNVTEVAPVVPTITVDDQRCAWFGFSVTDMPEGASLRVDFRRDGQAQYTTVRGDSWWSGSQPGWSDAYARVIAADGTELARSEVIQPTGCPTVKPTSHTCESFGFSVADMPAGATLRVDFRRDGQAQYTTVRTASWWSGTQRGWSDAYARVIASDGTVLARTEVIQPTGCTSTVTATAPKGKHFRGDVVTITGTVTGGHTSHPVDGTVTVSLQGAQATATVAADGTWSADLRLPQGQYAGLQQVDVVYSGNAVLNGSSTVTTVEVHTAWGRSGTGPSQFAPGQLKALIG